MPFEFAQRKYFALLAVNGKIKIEEMITSPGSFLFFKFKKKIYFFFLKCPTQQKVVLKRKAQGGGPGSFSQFGGGNWRQTHSSSCSVL